MAKVNKLELKEAINDYCRKKRISKKELSVQIGVNGAYLSMIENEKFERVTDAVLTKIETAINQRTVRENYSTFDYETVFRMCEDTRKYKLMSGLIADTGMGKTTSLKAYSVRENVFFVTVDKTMNAKRLFTAILREMQIAFDGNIHDVMLKIAEKLNRIESPLLIIDEAGKLNHSMILYLHVLREYTRENCGILLSGMPYFKDNIKKLADKQKEGYSEFYRRINMWQKLNGLYKKEIEFICQDNDISYNPKEFDRLRFADLMNKILLEQIIITNEIN